MSSPNNAPQNPPSQKSPYSRPQYHSTDRFTPIGFSSPIQQSPQKQYKGNFQRGNRQNQNFHRNRYQQNAGGWQNRNNKQGYVKKEESILDFYHPEMLEDPWKILTDKKKCSQMQNDNAENSLDTSSYRRSVSASNSDSDDNNADSID